MKKHEVNAFTGHALCQALKLEGMSDRAEANIESFLRRLWEHNGPDFVLRYLKVLKLDTERSLVDPNHEYSYVTGEISVSWDHKHHRPKGSLGYIYKRFPKAEERIRVIGAALCSIQLEEATPQQIAKMVSTVRGDTRSEATIQLSDKILRNLERHLERRVREVTDPFGPEDLTNNAVPYAHLCHYIDEDKRTLHKVCLHEIPASSQEAHRAILELHADKLGQFYTAPRICKGFWNSILDIAYHGNSQDIPEGVAYPTKVKPKPIEARDYETYTKEYGVLCDDSAEYSRRGAADYLGRFDFLQKPAGKLRTVANVNRYVNYTMEPFAKALEDVFYRHSSCFVLDQPEGLRTAQREIGKGARLSSLDLSSATDTLDFRVLIRELSRDFPGKTGLLEEYAKYFTQLSQLPLYCEALGSAIQFKTGQPLGMKGSFQVLTAMNILAGEQAEKEVFGNHCEGRFLVVGDDFICHSQMAERYNEIISSWGGSTNVEKCMESDKYAEFLSHIVTRDKVYITKPKYRPGNKLVYSNLEKAKVRSVRGIYRLSNTELTAIEILSKYSVDEMDYRNSLPHFRSKDLSLDDSDLEIMNTALQLVSEFRGRGSYTYPVSTISLDYLFEEDVLQSGSGKSIKDYTESPLVNGGLPEGPLIRDGITTMPTSTTVYDHHLGHSREKITRSQADKLVESKANDILVLHDVLHTNNNHDVDLGNNIVVSAESILLEAMAANDKAKRDLASTKEEAVENTRLDYTLNPNLKKVTRPMEEWLDIAGRLERKDTSKTWKNFHSKGDDLLHSSR